jgi:cytochrome c5
VSHTDDVFMSNFRNVIIGLGILFVIILVLAFLVSDVGKQSEAPNPDQLKAVQERIAPVAAVVVSGQEPQPAAETAPVEEAPKALSGAEVVKTSCFACHGTGAAGAPKIGDSAAWKPRVEQGMKTLVEHALKGFKTMPAKGGNPALSEADLEAAITFMLSETGTGESPAPAAPASPAPASEPEAVVPPAPAPAVAGSFDLADGEGTYNMVCVACHGMGVAGAPKVGDKVAWEARIAKGMDTLIDHAINGFNAMPPKGGAMTMSNAQIGNAVAYMVGQSK